MITRRVILGVLVIAVGRRGWCTDAQEAGPSVSVRDLRFAGGARGDGRSDDTRAIQAAIDASSVILIPRGRYLVTAPLRVPSGRRIIGQGTESILVKRSEDGLALIVNADPEGNSAITIEQLVIDGARRTQSFVAFRDGIHLTRCTGCRLNGVIVRDCLNDGIIIEYGAGNRVEGCTVSGNAKDGIYLSGTEDSYVGSNRATGNLLAGIAVAASISTKVSGSVCDDNRIDILLGRDATGVEVTGSDCRSDVAFAISPESLLAQTLHGKRYPGQGERGGGLLYGASHCRIHANTFAGQVRLILLNDSEFTDNVCTGSRTQGMVLQGASRNRIAGNTIHDWGKDYGGLQVAALTASDGIPLAQRPPITSRDNILEGNRIDDIPGRPSLLDAGRGTVLRTRP